MRIKVTNQEHKAWYDHPTFHLFCPGTTALQGVLQLYTWEKGPGGVHWTLVKAIEKVQEPGGGISFDSLVKVIKEVRATEMEFGITFQNEEVLGRRLFALQEYRHVVKMLHKEGIGAGWDRAWLKGGRSPHAVAKTEEGPVNWPLLAELFPVKSEAI